MIIDLGDSKADLRPFIYTAILWGLVSIGVILGFSSVPLPALKAWAGFFILSISDLFFLVKTIAATLLLMSDQGAENRSAYAIQALTYGSLKLLCLGAIGFFLWKFSDVPEAGMFFGLGSLIIVPLVGGFWWSQAQLKDEKRSKSQRA